MTFHASSRTGSDLEAPAFPSELGKYVLVTAAYNEEKFIERVIRSVMSQTAPPLQWVIVSDGSTDRTDEIVSSYAAKCSYLRLLRLQDQHQRNFGAQAAAIQRGCEAVKSLEYDFIGNLDADITLQRQYFQQLLVRFHDNPRLGLAGGAIYEQGRSDFEPRPTNSTRSVPHALQLFRRKCFEVVGGYRRLRYGGPDWVAEVMARKSGWHVESFPDLPAYHWRPTTGAEGLIRGCWREGCMDYSIGSLGLFEIFKCARRLGRPPYILGSLIRLFAFGISYARGAGRELPDDFVAYLQQEQRTRLSPFGGRDKRALLSN